MKTRLLLSIIILSACVAMPLHAGEVSYDTSADTCILSVSVYYDALAEQDPTPALQIFGDGTVLVHEPVWKSNAGDYSMQLSKKEVDALLAKAGDQGLFTTNVLGVKKELADVQASKRAALRANGQFPVYASKKDTYVIKTKVNSFKADGAVTAVSGADLTDTISYRGLRVDAMLNEEAEGVSNLWNSTSELLELCKHPNLTQID